MLEIIKKIVNSGIGTELVLPVACGHWPYC
jgi:hypothetical protein